MPNIIIREVDLTTPGINNTVTTNTAYVPGYAVTGPVNTPTLCETLEEFENIFGISPYVFKHDQYEVTGIKKDTSSTSTTYSVATDNTKIAAYKDSYETSYIYAVQALKSGIPVLFERVMDEGNIDTLTPKATVSGPGENIIALTLTSIYPGKANTSIYFTLTKNAVNNVDEYTLTVGRKGENGVKKVNEVATKFKIADIQKLNGNVDNSGLVKLSFNPVSGANINKATINEVKDKTPLTVEDSTADEFTFSAFYNYLYTQATWDRLLDRGEYNLKFLTTGSYIIPVTNSFDGGTTFKDIIPTMITTAATRGDCTALIDVKNDACDSLITYVNSHPKTITVNDRDEDIYSYAAAITPISNYYCDVVDKNVDMPGSYAYLTCLGPASSAYNNYFAIAGVNRGLIANINRVNEVITTAKAEKYQSRNNVSINPIQNIKPYGYCIWGNRTLKDNSIKGDLIASSFLNVRQLVSDVKKVVYTAAKSLTFEQNSDVLWINFKSKIVPTLEGMKSGNGLNDYKIERLATDKKATVKAKITLYVVEAVEDWDITIELSDSTVLVSE